MDKNKMIEKSISLLEKLEIFKPYINAYKEDNTNNVCFFEQFGGYYVYQDKEILDKMISIEKEYNVKVYAITHEYTEFGELYDFLVVTEYPEEWNTLVIKNKNTASVFAYVWNKDCEWYSEFGSIGIQCFGGGIRRIN